MVLFNRFSAIGHNGVIENRDCLFNPNADNRTVYLRRDEVVGFQCKFKGNVPKPEDQVDIANIHF